MSTCYPKKAANLASRVLKGEAIIMNPVDSSLFSLNETATAIWEAADGRTTLQEIVEREVCPRFEIDSESALRDAEEVVHALAEHSILLVSEEPADE
ncbi:MAG TPA: PqqD family protein [Bryobacteraceae bacterium]|jgi:hypothetical protein|nr:PqqD family protein [Bryobacteraceae bacterium]